MFRNGLNTFQHEDELKAFEFLLIVIFFGIDGPVESWRADKLERVNACSTRLLDASKASGPCELSSYSDAKDAEEVPSCKGWRFHLREFRTTA